MWFEVDKDGLAKLLERKGKAFAVLELIQNAWDAVESSKSNITRNVQISITPVPGRALSRLVVSDDHPDGFSDLRHSFTLFADTAKRTDPEQRGRFNLGEKLVLALCETACIKSTTGSVYFGQSGRRTSREKTGNGSEFSGLIRMTRDELEETFRVVSTVIPPRTVNTFLNGKQLVERVPVIEFVATLPTELADDDGYIRKTARKTTVQLFEVLDGEIASIYEMGIPVIDTGDKYHVNVLQKVPMNSDRDNVPPSYLQTLRVLVLNEMHQKLSPDESNADWARAATSDVRCSDSAMTKMLDHRFGQKRASYDPSDPESNMKVVSLGYTLITGRQMSKQEWNNARRAGVIPPAGQVAPCKPTFSSIAPLLGRDKWTDGMVDVVQYTKDLAYKLMGIDLSVYLLDGVGYDAIYERRDDNAASLTYYVKSLGVEWFDLKNPDVDRLIIHEFGHQISGNHLSTEYHEALCKIGADMKQLALTDPDFFNR